MVTKNYAEMEKGDGPDIWTFRMHISWEDCPHLKTPEEIRNREALIAKHGWNSSFIRSFLRGLFQRDTDENVVFTDHSMKALRFAMYGDVPAVRGAMKAAGDFSGGGDEQTLYVASGFEMVLAHHETNEDTDAVGEGFVEMLESMHVAPQDFYADAGGLGVTMINHMESVGYKGIHRYFNNNAPRNALDFEDRITEDTYGFIEKLVDPKYPIKLIPDPILLQQAKQRRFIINPKNNKIKLEAKKKHRQDFGSSPDRLETVVMLYADHRPYLPEELEPEYFSELDAKAAQIKGGMTGGDIRSQPNIFEMHQKALHHAEKRS